MVMAKNLGLGELEEKSMARSRTRLLRHNAIGLAEGLGLGRVRARFTQIERVLARSHQNLSFSLYHPHHA
jgi:hypothetical protein